MTEKDTVKILVVDDDPVIVSVVKRFLEKKNYTVLVAFDGVEALEKVRQEDPQVVLLDVSMPGKSGLEVLQEIKQHKASISVIMVTAITDETVGRHALTVGAFDYIIKPFDLSHLEKVLTWNLRLLD